RRLLQCGRAHLRFLGFRRVCREVSQRDRARRRSDRPLQAETRTRGLGADGSLRPRRAPSTHPGGRDAPFRRGFAHSGHARVTPVVRTSGRPSTRSSPLRREVTRRATVKHSARRCVILLVSMWSKETERSGGIRFILAAVAAFTSFVLGMGAANAALLPHY